MHRLVIWTDIGGVSSNADESLVASGLCNLMKVVGLVHSGEPFEEGSESGSETVVSAAKWEEKGRRGGSGRADQPNDPEMTANR